MIRLGPDPLSLAVTEGIAGCFLVLHLLRCFSSVGNLAPVEVATKVFLRTHSMLCVVVSYFECE